jgi:hypothetical protein
MSRMPPPRPIQPPPNLCVPDSCDPPSRTQRGNRRNHREEFTLATVCTAQKLGRADQSVASKRNGRLASRAIDSPCQFNFDPRAQMKSSRIAGRILQLHARQSRQSFGVLTVRACEFKPDSMPEQGRHPAFWQSAERSEKTTYRCLGKHLRLEESSSVLEFIAVEADCVRIVIVVTLWALRAALSRCDARWIAHDTVHVDGGSAVQLNRNRNHSLRRREACS